MEVLDEAKLPAVLYWPSKLVVTAHQLRDEGNAVDFVQVSNRSTEEDHVLCG